MLIMLILGMTRPVLEGGELWAAVCRVGLVA
ncbi:MAG: hypothetical protein DDT18_01587 [Actinobacteria bacterium]|nr:hypothetical protein [Actinomycetota bacterium]